MLYATTKRRPKVRIFLSLTAVFFLLIGIGSAVPSSAAIAATANITAPQCGNNVTLSMGTSASEKVRFVVYRSGRTGVFSDVYVTGPRNITVQVPIIGGSEIFNIIVDGASLVRKSVSPSNTACSPAQLNASGGISAVIGNASCSAPIPIAINNGASNLNWFEIWRTNQSLPDVVTTLPSNTQARFGIDIGSTSQTLKAVWNKNTLAQKTVSPATSCGGSSGGTSTPTATTTSTTTTTSPPSTSTSCTSAERASTWGCPDVFDNFDGSRLSSNWSVYNDPNNRVPRLPSNVRVRNGELQLVGTYNRSTNYIMGAGISQNYSQKYGRWEARIRGDNGSGYSHIALLWPSGGGKWPNDGEIDFLESPESPHVRAWKAVHNGPNNSQTGHWTNIDVTQWHTYATEWTPSAVRFYIDGNLQFTVTQSWLVPSTSPMHLALQIDAHPTSFGCEPVWRQCANSSTPAEVVMHVDYVKVWKY